MSSVELLDLIGRRRVEIDGRDVTISQRRGLWIARTLSG
jgi:hypothetical protein